MGAARTHECVGTEKKRGSLTGKRTSVEDASLQWAERGGEQLKWIARLQAAGLPPPAFARVKQ